MRFDRGTATVVGGDFGTTPHPLVFSSVMSSVTVLAKTFPGQPEVTGGGTIDQLPGLISYVDPGTGTQILTGSLGHRIGGGTLIRKHLSHTFAWPPGTVANGAVVAGVFDLQGARPGDTVVVAFDNGGGRMGGKILMFGSVAANDKVAVTLLNHYGTSLPFVAGTLRIDVWQH